MKKFDAELFCTYHIALLKILGMVSHHVKSIENGSVPEGDFVEDAGSRGTDVASDQIVDLSSVEHTRPSYASDNVVVFANNALGR